ncbi:MAG TPA: hypothetical protein VFH29_04805, partial [Anaerolineales bacterium]|nr:hypothetical protein [Anaerolineales bacterium]
MNFHDAELLSAYLDHQLDAGESARLEKRLAVDEDLRLVMDDLRVARGLLKRTPRRKAPRNFMLNPSDVRVLAPRPTAVPLLRYAGAIASFLFLFAVGTNAVLPSIARMRAAAPLAYGVGGGMGGGGGGAAEPETPPEAFAAAPAPAGTPAAEMPLAPQDTGPAAPDAQAKAAPPENAPAATPVAATPVVPAIWLLTLAVIALLAIGLSTYLDRYTRRKFRSRF